MKISLNAIKEIYKQAEVADFLPKDIDEITKKIGAQLGEIEEVVDLGAKYKDAVVVRVVSCIDHTNADKLKICRIDDGGKNKSVKRDKDGLVQVVCGAPNVKTDMFAVWLPPGATVPSTFDKEPFVLEAREIRGSISNGMLASANELAINDDHTGILNIDKKTEPGDSFAELYRLDDYIIDIENKMFTHRPDCFGLLGIARELAGIYGHNFKSPEWYADTIFNSQFSISKELKLDVVNEIPKSAPRFSVVTIADVKIAPSPIWLQVFLSKAGIKSINNVVDYTNFLMCFSGQPLHAYDYDKLAKLSGGTPTIKVRYASGQEKLKLLNGKEVTPPTETIVIATDKHSIGIGGVIGGSSTEVDDNTKNIIIECANFDPYAIRRTSMELGIFTDAVTRFSKGQSPLQTLPVITKAVKDLQYLSGGKPVGKLHDIKSHLSLLKPVKVSVGFINERLGLNLKTKDIIEILANVEITTKTHGDNLEITPPFWRTDIEIAEDAVEEVGRLYGYDHLPLKLPKKTMSPSVVSSELNLKQQIRESLSALGANEVLTYSFVHGNLLDATAQDRAKSFTIKNALSPDLQYYRQSLTPSLLEKIHPNIKAGYDDFALFELNKAHVKGKNDEHGLPEEFERLALVVAKAKNKGAAYFTAKTYLTNLLNSFGISEDKLTFTPFDSRQSKPIAAYYQTGRSAVIRLYDKEIGYIGEYGSQAARKLKLPEFCAGFELELEQLPVLAQSNYQPISRYPSISHDITLQTAYDLQFEDIVDALQGSIENHSPDDFYSEINCLDIFAKDNKSKNTTFRVIAANRQRTLTTTELNNLMDKVAADLAGSIKAERV